MKPKLEKICEWKVIARAEKNAEGELRKCRYTCNGRVVSCPYYFPKIKYKNGNK